MWGGVVDPAALIFIGIHSSLGWGGVYMFPPTPPLGGEEWEPGGVVTGRRCDCCCKHSSPCVGRSVYILSHSSPWVGRSVYTPIPLCRDGGIRRGSVGIMYLAKQSFASHILASLSSLLDLSLHKHKFGYSLPYYNYLIFIIY